jgi:hypothetical protein
MMRHVHIAIAVLMLSAPSLGASSSMPIQGGDPTATVLVECNRSSSLVQLSIRHHRKIGKVRIEVRDKAGRTLYLEEGKALTGELVRRLDKGIFPRGEHTMVVRSRDFEHIERFVCDH